MPALKKAMEQRQAAGAKVAQKEKTPKRRKCSLSDQNKDDDYNTDESQDSRFNFKADPNKIKDLNIG